jgi:hypothetical protein
MSKGQLYSWRILLEGAVICVAAALALNADVPRGWNLAGSKPAEYEVGVDKDQAYQGHASAFLKSKNPNVDGFGTLMQTISSEQYQGNRVRLSGLVKSEEVTSWAGLWMRVDKGKEMLAFDNMQKRAIKGTTGWQHYEVILQVPKDATAVSFGILLNGAGQVWLNSTKLEIVGVDVPTININENKLPSTPVNLEFAE